MKLFDRNFFIGFAAGAVIMILAIIGASVGLLWWVAHQRSGAGGFGLSAPDLPSAGAAGPAAPLDWQVETLEGEAVPMGDCRGQVVFLNFWATWCGPCRAEMPSIQKLHDALKGEGVRFVCVSQEEASDVREFLEKEKFTFPIYRMGGEPPAVFKTRGIPATFILDRAGRIAFQHVGSARWDDAACIRYLQALAADTRSEKE